MIETPYFSFKCYAVAHEIIYLEAPELLNFLFDLLWIWLSAVLSKLYIWRMSFCETCQGRDLITLCLFKNKNQYIFCFRAFDVELLYIAQFFKIPIAEIAVNWTEIEGE